MRRAIPAILLTAIGFYLVWQYDPTPDTVTAESPPAAVSTPSTPSTGSSGGTKTVEGSTESTEFGDVQVRVTFAGDRITAVDFVKLPRSGPSRQAATTLVEETLRAQTARIDTVSGATQTSESYVRSLQAAIDAKGA
ncbi:hypothetical protein GCM10029964_019930 [Kibdelosporangium lantanae]